MTSTATPAPIPAHDEHLTTGWEPDLPIDDTLLRRFVFNHAATWEAPTAAMGGRVLRSAQFAAADLGRPAGYWNGATLLQPLPGGDPTGSTVLDAIEGFFDGAGTGDVLLWSAWPTPDLRPRGWRLEGHPPLLIRPPGPLPEVVPVPGLRIDRVSDVVGLRDFERVTVEGYPFAELQPLVPGSLFDERVLGDDRLRLWVGYESFSPEPGRGRPVVVGALYVAHGIAGFVLGVTMPHARYRGYWAAMARHRLRTVPDLPAAGLFSDMSRSGAQRSFGFLPISRFTLWARPRPRDLRP